MSTEHPLLAPIRALHREIRSAVLAAFRTESQATLSAVAEDDEGDTIFAVDKVSEALLVRTLAGTAERLGGIVLIAEGISGGLITLPESLPEERCRYRVIVDPIDGTRCIMYQKRAAWILTGVAENHGPATRLSHIDCAVQTELPLLKQYLADELWAERGKGAYAERVNLFDATRTPLRLVPSQAHSIEHGYTSISRLFPGARDELAALDEEIVEALIGKPVPGKARCFEDQYASTGGQLYELMAGHDRFIADLRPLLGPLLAKRGSPAGLCCHPYDICTALIAEELGVELRAPDGTAFDGALNVHEDIAWVGYANAALRELIEPILKAALIRRGLLGSVA